MLCVQPYRKYARDGHLEAEYPCGRCIHCRIQRSREWSLRLTHELSYWPTASFITLTYDDDHNDGNLHPLHLTNYFREVRRHTKIKYFACGEYGETKGRPHYHAIVFGLQYTLGGLQTAKARDYRRGEMKTVYYVPEWKFGHVDIGVVTADSCRYTADYIFSAYDGDLGRDVYAGFTPPFRLSSKGLGRKWLEDNMIQIKQKPYLTTNGARHGLPRYYLKRMEMGSMEHAFAVDDAGYYYAQTGESVVETKKEHELSPVLTPKKDRLQNKRNLEAKHRTQGRS